MKTSNKLLLILLVFVIIAMVVVNLFLKNEMKTPAAKQTEIVQPSDTTSLHADSVAMDEANQNE